MKYYKKRYILILAMLFLLIKPLKAEASSLYGDGTKDNPYQINTVNDFITFEKEVNAGNTFAGCYIEQNKNLNFEKVDNIVPIGNPISGTVFCGTYNAKGHIIENININNFEYAAVFGHLSGTVENLGIESGSIEGIYAAGIVAFSSGIDARVINCYNKATVTGDRASGIAEQFTGSIFNCWNLGECIANDPQYGAGIVSSSANRLIYCYSTNPLISEKATVSAKDYCYVIDDSISSSDFPDIMNENLSRSIKLHVLSSDETVFWKYDVSTLSFIYDVDEYENNDVFERKYKGLRTSAKGTKNDPIKVSDLEDMVLFRYAVNSGVQNYQTMYVKLENDIDFSKCKNWEPIGDTDKNYFFAGKFDGNGNKITNLVSNQKGYASLFELLSGEVYNLQLINVDIYGTYAAGIACVGYNEPSIYNCSVQGKIIGSRYAAGIVNEFGKGRIFNCWTLLSDSANGVGICSKSCDTAEYCYSNLALFGNNYSNYICNERENFIERDFHSREFANDLNINLAKNVYVPFEIVDLWEYDENSNELALNDANGFGKKVLIWFSCYWPIYIFVIIFIVSLYIWSKIKTNTISKNNRNTTIDLLRLFFGICIVLLHWGQWNGDEKLFIPCGYNGVTFFYIVSGYLLAQKVFMLEEKKAVSKGVGKETVSYVAHKIKRILPYYVVALILSFVAVSYFTYSSKEQLLYNLGYYVSEILMLQMAGFPTYAIIGTEWYLSALIVALLIIYPLVRKHRQVYTYIMAPLIGIMGLGWISHNYGNMTSTAMWTGICLEGVLRAIALISLGVIAFEISRFVKEKYQNPSYGLTFMEVFIWILVFAFMKIGNPYTGMDFLITLLIFVGIIISFSEVTFLNSFIGSFWGNAAAKISIPLFLCHGYLLLFLPKYLKGWGKWNALNIFLICVGVSVAIDLVLGNMMKKLFEKGE